MDIKPIRQYIEYLKLSGINNVFLSSFSVKKSSIDDLESLAKIYSNCEKCALYKGRIKFVYGEGDPQTKLMLIGEGPGADENVTGRPFVGKAGQLLTKMLKAINIKRNEVYITNVIKCRPPENRNPLPMEIKTCLPYLEEQISIIKPVIILILGRVAADALLKMNTTLTKYRENIHFYNGIKTYVTYHPSALLRNPGWKKYAWIDLQKLRDDYNNLEY